MPGEEPDRHHDKDHKGHDEYAGKRLFHPRENNPEGHVQYHDLNGKPHLVVYQKDAEEAADDFSESEVIAADDVVYQRIGQVDVIADEERYEDREDPSSHESFDIVFVGHEALDETETGTEEEERDRKDAVKVEERKISRVFMVCFQCDNGLVEHDEDGQNTLDLFARYTIEKCRIICRPSGRPYEQDSAKDGQANV